MTPLTREWVERAEEDFSVAAREHRLRKNPALNTICFHAQQCAEKYLKACIHHAGLRITGTHDLIVLIDQLKAIESQWELLKVEAAVLSEYAVAFRYPGVSATRSAARKAMNSCREIRERARAAIGLRVGPKPSGARSLGRRSVRGGVRRRRKKK